MGNPWQQHIVTIENGQTSSSSPKADPSAARLRARFGFFGHITEYKGVEILLQAIHLISSEFRAKMIFEIHGPISNCRDSGFRN